MINFTSPPCAHALLRAQTRPYHTNRACGGEDSRKCPLLRFVQVAQAFNQPLLKYYATKRIEGLDPNEYGTDPIYYLVDEYDEGNASGAESKSQWDGSWYIKQEDKVAGLLTDFHFRHSPEAYSRPNDALIRRLRLLFVAAPGLSLTCCFFCF